MACLLPAFPESQTAVCHVKGGLFFLPVDRGAQILTLSPLSLPHTHQSQLLPLSGPLGPETCHRGPQGSRWPALPCGLLFLQTPVCPDKLWNRKARGCSWVDLGTRWGLHPSSRIWDDDTPTLRFHVCWWGIDACLMGRWVTQWDSTWGSEL